MWDRIKNWAIVVGSILIAILTYLFQRRGDAIRDLKRHQVNQEMDKSLKQEEKRVELGEKDYEDAKKEYRRLRAIYDKLKHDKGGDVPSK